MQIKSLIEKNQVKFLHTLVYKFNNDIKSITLSDQDEACKYWYYAYEFAKLNIPGTDITKCQQVACKDPYTAYKFTRDIPGADIEYCQEYVKAQCMLHGLWKIYLVLILNTTAKQSNVAADLKIRNTG